MVVITNPEMTKNRSTPPSAKRVKSGRMAGPAPNLPSTIARWNTTTRIAARARRACTETKQRGWGIRTSLSMRLQSRQRSAGPPAEAALLGIGCRSARTAQAGRGAPLEWRPSRSNGASMSTQQSAGARFRAAVAEESPLQVMGAITAYAGLMAKRVGYKALYLSGGGVAANSLGMPDLGISTMEDVLTDARRIVDATGLPLLVDIDTGWGGAFNIARTVRSFERVGVAAVHMEDQVGQKRCGHRPGKEVVSRGEMVDRVKAAVDARTDPGFVIMARTDAAASEGIESAIDRA